ncbi:hypothetical protein ABIF81_004976 [Bradyrhizobium daqingense]
MIRLLEGTLRGGSRAAIAADKDHVFRQSIVTERSTCAECSRRRLLAGGAYIHVDFHAAGHFDDLRGFPGHLALHFREFGRIRPWVKLMRAQKFASEIFPI